jgi:uncharacterized membrane protein YbhN (UPF0104 family)
LNTKRARGLIQIAVSALLLALILRQVHWAEVRDALGRIDVHWLALAWGLFLLGVIVRAARWQVLLAALGVHRPLRELMTWYFVGGFFNVILPTGFGGDAVRVAELAQDTSRPAAVLNSVLVDRYLGIMVLLPMGLVAAVLAPGAAPAGVTALTAALFIGGLAVAWLLRRPQFRSVAHAGRGTTADENAAEHPERSGRVVSATQSKGAERSSHKAASFDFVRHTTPDSAQFSMPGAAPRRMKTFAVTTSVVRREPRRLKSLLRTRPFSGQLFMPGAAPRRMKAAEAAPMPPERRAWEPDPLFSGQDASRGILRTVVHAGRGAAAHESSRGGSHAAGASGMGARPAIFRTVFHAGRGATAHESSRGGSHAAGASGMGARPAIFRTAAWIRGFSRSGGQSEKPAEASIPTNQQSIFRAGSQRARAFFSAARLSALADAAAPYDRRAIGRGLAISLVFNLLQIGWNVAIGRGLGLALPLTVYLAFVPLTAVALLLPAFGGLGVRELTYAGLFASAGVPQPTALALSLGVYLITVATGVVGGALYLVHGLRGVKAADRSGEADEYRG